MVVDHQVTRIDHHHPALLGFYLTMKARFSQILGAASALAVCAPQSEALADDIFLQLEGLKGDSVAPKHKEEIEITAFSMGHARPFTMVVGGGGGTSSAQPSFSDIQVQAPMSSLSPKLAEFCATGKSIPKAKLSVQTLTTSKETADYYKVELEGVRITSFQTSAQAGSAKPIESFSLSYTKITWIFVPLNTTQTTQKEVKEAFDLATGNP
jgi:type VI secretion system secreted protein Hcp